LKEFFIFIAHPRDVKKECSIIKNIISEETINHFRHTDYAFRSICWEDDAPAGAGRPQDKINPLVEESVLVIIVLWTIFGSTTGREPSGIEEEYKLACELSISILLFFSDCKLHPSSIDPKQLSMVRAFKAKIEKEKKLLYIKYITEEEFYKKFRRQFSTWAHDFIKDEETKKIQIDMVKRPDEKKVSKKEVEKLLQSKTKGF